MTRSRDFQRTKVYAWEQATIVPHDRSIVPYGALQGMVSAIWSDLGLTYPPAVEPLPKAVRTFIATGSRLTLCFPEQTSSWVVLHEIAHSLSSDFEGRSDRHGPLFVGHYLKLIERFMPQIDAALLIMSLRNAGIQFVRDPKPLFSY